MGKRTITNTKAEAEENPMSVLGAAVAFGDGSQAIVAQERMGQRELVQADELPVEGNVTLCMGGTEAIHHSQPWHDACPRCGKQPDPRPVVRSGPAAVELGFAQPNTARPVGVAGCSSFTWAMAPERARALLQDGKVVADEYGRTMAGPEFLAMLAAQCPIEFTHLVGREFS